MKRTILFTAATIFLFLGVDCKDAPVQPATNSDTTSHNFSVLRVDTLGTLFSFANGVDIVDENNIWVAGIFTERDTNGEILYNKNLAHWDGLKWTLMSVPMMGYNNTGPDPQELGAVKVFNDSLIFVVAKHDNSVAWWNGKKWVPNYVNDAVVSPHFWARSPNDIYFVAREGRATYFNGQTFTKINTGLTNPPLLDVWGDEEQIFTVGSPDNIAQHGEESVFIYSNNKTTINISHRYSIINDTGKPNYLGYLNSVYRANKDSKLWIFSGEGHGTLVEVSSLQPFLFKKYFEIPNVVFPKLLRGNADNDLFLFGALGSLWHYNGASWKYFESPSNFLLLSCAVKNNTITQVGAARGDVVSYGMAIILQRK